ncbi:hypothetical protein PIB30_017284 [Stylosanthes scabra]|uniref:Glycine-rich protein n=1 Tax=Stylosanthes scabra TaxID=79078 RepID=A0ABU6R7T5_9FABA|nr:hypothetical protein [Stylosanthes scabra]
MGCKALLVLVMFMVTILLTSSEKAPKDLLDEKFDQNYDESKQYRGHRGGGFSGHGGYGGGFGGPRRAAHSGGLDDHRGAYYVGSQCPTVAKMGCKALLVLVIFMVTIILTASEEAPRNLDEKFDQNNNDGNNNDPIQAIDESKQYRGGRGGGFGGRGGYGGGFGSGLAGYGGPWRWGRYGGGWRGGDRIGPTYGFSPLVCPYGCCVWTVQYLCARCC